MAISIPSLYHGCSGEHSLPELIVAAFVYEGRATKHASAEAAVTNMEKGFQNAVNGLLSNPTASQQNIKDLYQNLEGCKKAQQKIVVWFAKFKEEKIANASTDATVDSAFQLGSAFNKAHTDLGTEEYKKDRKIRREYKNAIQAALKHGHTCEQITELLIPLKFFSSFFIEQTKAFANKPSGEQSKAIKKQNKQAFFAFINAKV